ncbi:MAG TPA: VOC family protein [Candidatus Obscuribacterales bacterium]
MAKVDPIPRGFHTITPSLTVKDAEKAIEFYKKAFGAEQKEICLGPDGKSIMHAELKIGDSIIMLNDEYPDMGCRSPNSLGGSPVSLYLYVDDVDAWYARAVGAGATSVMPVADMFWGDRFGAVVDPFGHKWSIATHIKDMTPEEIARGQEAWKKQMDLAAAKK